MTYSDSEKAKKAECRDYWEDINRRCIVYCDCEKAKKTYDKVFLEECIASSKAKTELYKANAIEERIQLDDGNYRYSRYEILPNQRKFKNIFAHLIDDYVEDTNYDKTHYRITKDYRPDFILLSENLWTYNVSSKSTIN